MAKLFVQIHDPAGERAVSYEGMDAATITGLVQQFGFPFDFIEQAAYDAFVEAHKPVPPTPAQIIASFRSAAASELTASSQPLSVLQKAILAVILDEINTIRGLLVPAATPRTVAQFKNAIQNKITGGQGD
jgi:hypothetical protein